MLKSYFNKVKNWYGEYIGLKASIVICLYAIVFSMMLSTGICRKIYSSKLEYRNITIQTYCENGADIASPPFRIVDNYAYNQEDKIILNGQSVASTDANGIVTLENTQKTQYTPSFEEIVGSIILNDGFTIVYPEESKTGYGYMEASRPGAMLVLNLPMFNSVCLSVEKNGTAMGIHLSDDQGEIECWYTADRYQPATNVLSQKLYFIQDSSITYLFKYFVLWYVGVFTVIYILLALVYYSIFHKLRECKILMSYTPKRLFLILFLVQFSFTAFLFYSDRDAYAVGGAADAYYYMSPEKQPQFLNAEGEFSLDLYIQNGWSHRGYLPTFISLFFNRISQVTGIDAMVFQFMLTTLFSMVGVCVALPMLYKVFWGSTPHNFSILVSWLVFCYFWNSHFFYVLTDIPAAMAVLMAMAFFLTGIKNNKHRDLFLSGVFLGIGTGYRAVYGILAKIFMAVFLIIWFIQTLKQIFEKKQMQELFIGAIFASKKMIFLLVGVILIMLPQLFINIGKGKTTLFPYQTNTSYHVMEDSYRTLTVGSLTNYKFGTASFRDRQLNAVWSEYFMPEMGADMSLGDVIVVACSNPIEFSAGLCKKIFYSLSNSGQAVYKAKNDANRMQWGYFLNYFMLGVFSLLLFRGKIGTKKLTAFYCFTGGISLVPWLLQVLIYHIEFRYYLVLYLLIYFVFSYFGTAYIIERQENKLTNSEMKYSIVLLFFVIICYTTISTINHNF